MSLQLEWCRAVCTARGHVHTDVAELGCFARSLDGLLNGDPLERAAFLAAAKRQVPP